MLEISSSAVKEIKRIQCNQAQPDVPLKLTISSGGCSGLFYDLKLDDPDSHDFPESDRVIEIDQVKLVIDGDSWEHIANLRIDYSEDLMGGGFRFHNPQAKDVCGCGISFAIAEREAN